MSQAVEDATRSSPGGRVRESAYVERDEQWDGFTTADILERLDVDFRSRRGGETQVGELLLNLGYEKRRDGGGARLNRYWLGSDAERLI